eukprot:7681309-Pyramimonas_sp.AAC.1
MGRHLTRHRKLVDSNSRGNPGTTEEAMRIAEETMRMQRIPCGHFGDCKGKVEGGQQWAFLYAWS